MTQSFLINIDPFCRDIIVCFGSLRDALLTYHDVDKVDALLSKLDFSNPRLKGKTIYDNESGILAVWSPAMPTTPEDFGFLVHELFHATCVVIATIGAQPSDDTEEVYAYLLGYLTKRVLDELPVTFSVCGREIVSGQNLPKS